MTRQELEVAMELETRTDLDAWTTGRLRATRGTGIRPLRGVVVFSFLLLLALSATAQRLDLGGPHLSPFRAMRQVDGSIEVKVAGDRWATLLSVAGVDASVLWRGARRLAPDDPWKRVTEDLPALLRALGVDVGPRVDVVVRDRDSGEARRLEGVEMTAGNRKRLLLANRSRAGAITQEQVRADLEELRRLLDERFSYRHLRGVDLDDLLRSARSRLTGPRVQRNDLAREVRRILSAFGDGHSRVVDEMEPERPRWLPFLVQSVTGGHAAFWHDRSGFVDERYPYLVELDGLPLERWLEAARRRVTQGSPTLVDLLAESTLRELGELRADLGLDDGYSVRVGLRSTDGEEVEHTVLPTAAGRPSFGSWPLRVSRVLDGNIGYLRIFSMRGDDQFLEWIDGVMAELRDTDALVIDVRGNGGGHRDALLRLAPYFLRDDPVVGNVAAVLLDPDEPLTEDVLADRFLYPADWSGWSDAERRTIDEFARTFEPSWEPPAGRFSPWHYLVLSREDEPRAFQYQGPVALLVDRACFSATDVFAAALQAIPGIHLVGERTAGGSGRARKHRLHHSGIDLQLSTMASYRPDGVLFEGNGVVPDVEVATVATDLVGRTDVVLDRALEVLARELNGRPSRQER